MQEGYPKEWVSFQQIVLADMSVAAKIKLVVIYNTNNIRTLSIF